MEQSLLDMDMAFDGHQVLDTIEQFEPSEIDADQSWRLKSDDSLDWLNDFSTPNASLQPEESIRTELKEAPEFGLNACEEGHFFSFATIESSDNSDESQTWLSSLENNSELDHQVAEASLTSSEFTAAEQQHAVRFSNHVFNVFTQANNTCGLTFCTKF